MKRFSVRWTDAATSDLTDILAWIERDAGHDRAGAVYRRIRTAAQRLERSPNRGRVVPELASIDVREYRELVLAPWRLLYRVRRRVVFVAAVLDARRDLADVLLARFSRES